MSVGIFTSIYRQISMIDPFPLKTAPVFYGRPLIYHPFPQKKSPYILHFEMFIIYLFKSLPASSETKSELMI